MSANLCAVHWLGTAAYESTWRLQEEYAAEIAAGQRPPTLLLLEHPHTYTFGRGGHRENLLWSEEECQRRGVSIHWVDRGGDVTYHGPGQLVGYPLLPLGSVNPSDSRLPAADYIGYLRKLEETLIRALGQFGVAGERIAGRTGVWVQLHGIPAKIAAIGVKVDARGVSRHGFALNVAPDMAYWQGIIGCGLKDAAVASLALLLDPVPGMDAVREAVVQAFGQVFDCKMEKEKEVE